MAITDSFPTSREDIRNLRAKWIPLAQGLVAEIGFGEGANLPYFGSGIRELMAIDPDIEMTESLQARLNRLSFPVLFSSADAEHIQAQEGVFDFVVSTWTLCSVKSLFHTLLEVRRVLKPGGHFLFLEHGFSRDEPIQLAQSLWTPLQRIVANGCHLNRPMLAEIQGAGFRLEEHEESYVRGWRPFSFVSAGLARKPLQT